MTARTISGALLEGARKIGRTDARVLLAFVTGRTKEYFIMHPETELTEAQARNFQAAVNRVANGCPVPYVTGRQSFWGRDFSVNEHVLIPRPDTETLIEAVLALNPIPSSILDMGTGSGCIAVTLALELPQASITATDVSSEALAVAHANARTLGATNVTFSQGAWYAAVNDQIFDVIVSNPPYIEPDDEHLAKLTFEPIGALTDGIDGLSDIREIAAHASNHLNAGGSLVLEHGYNQGEAVREIFTAAGFVNVHTVRDLGGNERITLGHLA